jgi:intracellular sulfur oxidation DsrE/DsrF family protein
MPEDFLSAPQRRSFLTALNVGAGALTVGSIALAQDKPAISHWEPTRHAKDDWMEMPVKHRVVFDTTSLATAGEAIFFANNFIHVNRAEYGLQNSDMAVIVIVRHNSTAFGYNDAMWAKYGAHFSSRSGLEDPKTKTPPKVNLLNSGEYGEQVPNHGVTLDALFKQGVQLAVCSAATQALSRTIAKAVENTNAEAIYTELTANLVSNSRMVPAGIVALNRAQERGYSTMRT